MTMEKQTKPGPPCLHDPACVGPIPCPLCVADIRLPESELQMVAGVCGFQMSSNAPGTGNIHCNRNYGHLGGHGYAFKFIPAPEVKRLQRLQNDHLNAQVDMLDLQHRPPFIVEPMPRWVLWFVFVVGIVFGAAVAALVLLYPYPIAE